MTDFINNYSSFRNILPKNHTPVVNFDTYIKLVKLQNYEKKSDSFLELLKIDKIKTRDLVSIIILTYYSDIVADNPDIDNKTIVCKCKEFFDNLEDKLSSDKIEEILENDVNQINKIVNTIKTEFNQLCDMYLEWKQQDLDRKLQEFINGYYELEQMYLNLSIYKEDEEITPSIEKIRKQQQQLKMYIKRTGGDYGLKLLNSKSPVYINMEQFKQVATKAFWDTFQEKLEQDPPDYSRLVIILKEVKQLFVTIIPHRYDIHRQIDEGIDIDLLMQMLNNQSFDFDHIHKLMTYIVSLIQQFQSAGQDETTQKWWDSINEMNNSDNTYGKLITEFFKGVFEQIEKIQEQIKEFKQQFKS